MRDARGFTLVEIMIVVMVIALLAALAIPSFVRAREQSQMTIVKNDLRIISAAIDQLAFDAGQWPGGGLAGTTANDEMQDLNHPSVGLVANSGIFLRWKGPYIDNIESDPWGNDYWFDPDYRVGALTVSAIGSYGPNGVGLNLYDSDDIIVLLE